MSRWLRAKLNRDLYRALSDPHLNYRISLYFVVGWLLLVTAFPIYWMFTVAVTPPGNITEIYLAPAGLNFMVFVEVFDRAPVHRYILNSLVIAGVTTVLLLTVASLCGYAFGRLEFKYRKTLFLSLLAISYFPGIAFLIPLSHLFSGNMTILGIDLPQLINTPFALILPLSALILPFATYLLTIFYSQIPEGLENAARVSGTTRLGALYRVILPLSLPGVTTAGIISFIIIYNEFFFSYIFYDGNPDNWSPMLWGIVIFQQQYSTDYHFMAAASLIALVPIAILLLVAQRRIVQGLMKGGLKG